VQLQAAGDDNEVLDLLLAKKRAADRRKWLEVGGLAAEDGALAP